MLKTIVVFINPIEAHIIRGRLEAEGIPAFVIHEYHIWANWFFSNAVGGVKVQVNSTDATRAKEILSKLENAEFEKILEENEGPFEVTSCPKCGSQSISECRWNEKISLIILWAYVIPIPYIQGKLKCLNCGAKWVSKERQSYPLFARFTGILLITVFYILITEGLYHVCKISGTNPQCLQ